MHPHFAPSQQIHLPAAGVCCTELKHVPLSWLRLLQQTVRCAWPCNQGSRPADISTFQPPEESLCCSQLLRNEIDRLEAARVPAPRNSMAAGDRDRHAALIAELQRVELTRTNVSR
jgi:hypothetical protein